MSENYQSKLQGEIKNLLDEKAKIKGKRQVCQMPVLDLQEYKKVKDMIRWKRKRLREFEEFGQYRDAAMEISSSPNRRELYQMIFQMEYFENEIKNCVSSLKICSIKKVELRKKFLEVKSNKIYKNINQLISIETNKAELIAAANILIKKPGNEALLEMYG